MCPVLSVSYVSDTTKKAHPQVGFFCLAGVSRPNERARSTNAPAFGPRREGGAQPDEAPRAITAHVSRCKLNEQRHCQYILHFALICQVASTSITGRGTVAEPKWELAHTLLKQCLHRYTLLSVIFTFCRLSRDYPALAASTASFTSEKL